MSSQFFTVKEHVVEAQHIREYPRATAQSQEDVLYLAVKQYIPKNNPNPQPGDVTIIGAHANGFVKVCDIVTPHSYYCLALLGENIFMPCFLKFPFRPPASLGSSLVCTRPHRFSEA